MLDHPSDLRNLTTRVQAIKRQASLALKVSVVSMLLALHWIILVFTRIAQESCMAVSTIGTTPKSRYNRLQTLQVTIMTKTKSSPITKNSKLFSNNTTIRSCKCQDSLRYTQMFR